MPRSPKSARSRKSGAGNRSQPSPIESSSVGTWSSRRRSIISVFLFLHLLAVFTAPFTFAASGPNAASPFALGLMNALRPYIDVMYLNHGYFFFAPEPGPSHLLRCRLEFDDGRDDLELVFPDRHRQWPRLLYHRHFMLTEQLNSSFVPGDPPEGMPMPELLEAWRRDRAYYETRRSSFENHLRNRYGASRVTLVRVEHRPPAHAEVMEGLSLRDESLYRDLPETWEDAGEDHEETWER